MEGSTASNSIERFLTGHADDPPGAKLVDIIQYCMDTVLIDETVVMRDVLVDVKVTVDTDGCINDCFS